MRVFKIASAGEPELEQAARKGLSGKPCKRYCFPPAGTELKPHVTPLCQIELSVLKHVVDHMEKVTAGPDYHQFKHQFSKGGGTKGSRKHP
jgi:hypothetical protein